MGPAAPGSTLFGRPGSQPLLLQNELGILEFIHCMVETLDKWFSNVCELDIMFSLETVGGLLLAAAPAHAPSRSCVGS